MSTAPRIRLVLWKAAKAIDNVDRESIADTGMQLSGFTIMEVLLHKGPLPINAIGAKVLLTSGSMTAAINRWQKRDSSGGCRTLPTAGSPSKAPIKSLRPIWSKLPQH